MGEFIHANGDYRTLLSFKLAQKISVITEIFVERFLRRGSRTIDQMQQAARSCKQNIVEGSAAAPTSKETEIKLTNVARALLIIQTEYLLDRMIAAQERRFLENGGIREVMSSARREYRTRNWNDRNNWNNQNNRSNRNNLNDRNNLNNRNDSNSSNNSNNSDNSNQ